MTIANAPEFLKVDEVAAIVRHAPSAVRRAIRLGQLPATKFGRSYLVAKNNLAKVFGIAA